MKKTLLLLIGMWLWAACPIANAERFKVTAVSALTIDQIPISLTFNSKTEIETQKVRYALETAGNRYTSTCLIKACWPYFIKTIKKSGFKSRLIFRISDGPNFMESSL